MINEGKLDDIDENYEVYKTFHRLFTDAAEAGLLFNFFKKKIPFAAQETIVYNHFMRFIAEKYTDYRNDGNIKLFTPDNLRDCIYSIKEKRFNEELSKSTKAAEKRDDLEKTFKIGKYAPGYKTDNYNGRMRIDLTDPDWIIDSIEVTDLTIKKSTNANKNPALWEDIIDSALKKKFLLISKAALDQLQQSIQKAAFIEIMYNKNYIGKKLHGGKLNRKLINEFSKSYFGIDISASLSTSKKKDRENAKTRLAHYFRPDY